MDQGIPAAVNPTIKKALTLLATRGAYAALYRRYYEGDHDLQFASVKFTNAFGALFRTFAYNLCPSVVDALADRCKLEGFGSTTAAKKAGVIWKRNRMNQQAGQVHADSFMVGDSYVIVWPGDDGQAEITVNDAENVVVSYDPEHLGRLAWAVKCWVQDDNSVRLTFYTPDSIEKYVTGPRSAGTPPPTIKAFRPYEVPGEPWPLPNPYGVVPVFHFPNNAGVGKPGISELKAVKSLQDALNKSVADMLVSMETQALPQRWATGLEVDRDEKGRPRNQFTNEPGAVWAVADTEVNFGQFTAADLTQFLAVAESFEIKIARVSRTPLHWILPQGGNPPSGEALRTAEAPLVAKVGDRTEAFGPIWVEVMTLALRIDHPTEAINPTDLEADWKSAASPASLLEEAQVAKLHSEIGLALREIMIKDLHYTETEADQILAEAEAQAQQRDAATLATQTKLLQAAAMAPAPDTTPPTMMPSQQPPMMQGGQQ